MHKLTIPDRIYGNILITEPVIIDLINSKPFQRMKKINQHGAGQYVDKRRDVTRYEHGIGAWYLSSRFNRPIEEQIASLLHDIPHTAFSHVIDLVVGDRKHEYHDRFLEKVIRASEIPQIVKTYGVELDKILATGKYPLLQNKLPDISVDRWDYFMRDGFACNILPKETVDLFLDKIKEKDQRFYFEDINVASLFAVMFMNCSRLLWLDPLSVGAFSLLSEAIKRALKLKQITTEDFFTTDEVLWDKLHNIPDSKISALLKRLRPGADFEYVPKSEAEFYGPNKPRFVDPWVMNKGKLRHLSDLVPGMTDYFKEFTQTHTYLGVKEKK